MQPYSPRLDYLRPDFWRPNIEGYLLRIGKTLSKTCADPQASLSGVASGYMTVGLFTYATGYPIEQVRDYFIQAAQAYLKVFELRGTQPPFPVTLVTLDPSKKPDEPGFEIERRPMHPPGAVDHSLTNSKKGLSAVYITLAGGDDRLADKLTSLLWDPPDARWLRAKSVVCTLNDHHLAYAVKYLFAGDAAGVEAELSQVRIMRKDQLPLRFHREMIRGLAAHEPEKFLAALKDLLTWHTKEARAEKNKYEPDYYLCLPAVGLSAWAARHGFVSLTQLPHDDVYLPLQLVSARADL
jgi:Immunity protein 49